MQISDERVVDPAWVGGFYITTRNMVPRLMITAKYYSEHLTVQQGYEASVLSFLHNAVFPFNLDEYMERFNAG